MGFATRIGKYQLGRTIGEGTFAKVKLAVDSESGQFVAVKVIDKKMILKNKLMYQVSHDEQCHLNFDLYFEKLYIYIYLLT